MISTTYSQTLHHGAQMKNTGTICSAWHRFTTLSTVMGLLSLPALKDLWQLWHSDKNFDGLLLVPFMCALIIYRNKDRFIQCKPEQANWILYLLPATLWAMFAASNYNLPRIAGLLLPINLLIASFGVLGFSNYKLFAGPLIFLMLMVPPPQLAADFMIVNLQRLFSMIMETVLFGFSDLFLERNGFEFWFEGINYAMVIAPECSGIRSLFGFVIMSSFLAVFDKHSITIAILVITTGIVTSLTLNFFRILITMQLRLHHLHEYSVGIWHGLLGIAVFIVGCLILCKFSTLLKPLKQQTFEEDKK